MASTTYRALISSAGRAVGAPINHLLRVLGVVTALGGVGLIYVSGYVVEDSPSVAP